MAEVRSWREAHARKNHNIGLGFGDGWLFAKVLHNEIIPYPYTRLSNIAGGVGSNFAVLKDANSEEILYENKKKRIMEIFHGWNHPKLQIYYRYPEGIPRGGLQSDIGFPTITSSAYSGWGWLIEGWESPYEEPTERGSFFLPTDVNVEFALWNPEPSAVKIQPEAMFIINRMDVRPFNPLKEQDKKWIIDMLRQRKPCTLWSPGIEPVVYSDFKENYGVNPVIYDGVQISTKDENGNLLVLAEDESISEAKPRQVASEKPSGRRF